MRPVATWVPEPWIFRRWPSSAAGTTTTCPRSTPRSTKGTSARPTPPPPSPLPLPNGRDAFGLGGVDPANGIRWTAGNTPPGPSHWEHPAQGLLVWDDIATSEPAIDNTHVSQTHAFRVASPVVVGTAGSGLAVARGQLRVALAWTDPPSVPGSGGPLVNDLDLVLEGPGPRNCLFYSDVLPYEV